MKCQNVSRLQGWKLTTEQRLECFKSGIPSNLLYLFPFFILIYLYIYIYKYFLCPWELGGKEDSSLGESPMYQEKVKALILVFLGLHPTLGCFYHFVFHKNMHWKLCSVNFHLEIDSPILLIASLLVKRSCLQKQWQIRVIIWDNRCSTEYLSALVLSLIG